VVADAIGPRRAKQLAAASLAVSLCIQLPMRAAQVERVVRPYYLASNWMASLPEKFIIFPAAGLMWGNDLVRNDPFLEHGNMVMNESDFGPTGLGALQRRYPGQVRFVHGPDFVRFGLERAPLHIGPLLITP
jgi:hypothetical protein